ncbi:hypothetical protein GLOIN_2v244665 [Rhizophagus clarus]|uniref:Uncharacterized protein n=1 Tax=Rhizophagus clarus TaxID=94130 RepID=A0A8H3LMI2_9GLOM|nr:hypothetical protein GLOIN_2v244665 [Rhizophagus clarus]
MRRKISGKFLRRNRGCTTGLCIEKKLFLAETGVCPFPGCEKSIGVPNREDTASITEEQLRTNPTETNPEEISPETPREDEVPDQEMDVDGDDRDANGEENNEESTRPEETSSNSKSKKRANEATDSSASKKSKKRDLDEDSNILKRLIRELSSDTTRISITNAEERNEKARHELIIAYYYYGEELEKRLVHYREKHEEHEADKKINNEVRDQLPKEKNAIRKKTERARKVYDLFFRNEWCTSNE